MSDQWVCNASPLILLKHIGHLRLLTDLCDILVDLSARKCARSLGIPLRGTVGIILLAKKRGYISKAAPLIESLIDAGLRFDMKWINEALELVGESLKLD